MMKLIVGVIVLSLTYSSALESWIDIYSGEHFDDIVGTTDGSKKLAVNAGLLLYRTSCVPDVDVRKHPPSNNLIFFQMNTQTSRDHIWYQPLATDDLRKRYAAGRKACQVGLYLRKGDDLIGPPASVWNPNEEPEFGVWLWKMARIEVTLVNNLDETLGITSRNFEHSPVRKYEFIYPGEELNMLLYPAYDTVITSTDKATTYHTFMVRKKERIIIEKNMEQPDLQPIREKEWDKAHEIILWAKHNSIRHLSNMKQPLFVHNYTETGWKKMDIPTSTYKVLIDFYHKNRAEKVEEDYLINELLLINKHEVKPSMIKMSDGLIDVVSAYILPTMEEFCDCKLDYSATYGIQELHKGNIIRNHVSNVNSFVITALFHISETPNNSSSPLHIVCFGGTRHDVETRPGQMVIIESTKVIHGRPKTFMGKNMVLLEMAFVPRSGWDYKVDGFDLINEKTGEEEPLWEKETEFTKNRKMFAVKDEL